MAQYDLLLALKSGVRMTKDELIKFIKGQIQLQDSLSTLVAEQPPKNIDSRVNKTAIEQIQLLNKISVLLKSSPDSITEVNQHLREYFFNNRAQCDFLQTSGSNNPLLSINTATLRLLRMPVLNAPAPNPIVEVPGGVRAEQPPQVDIAEPPSKIQCPNPGPATEPVEPAAPARNQSAVNVDDMLSIADTLLSWFRSGSQDDKGPAPQTDALSNALPPAGNTIT